MTTVYQAADPSADIRFAQLETVSVSGKVIPAASIAREMQHHEAATPLDAWNNAARALVVRELLLQEAQRLGLTPVPRGDDDGRMETDEEALIREVTERQISSPAPSDAECHRYYERNLDRFRSADIFEASHILLAARPDDRQGRARAKQMADGLLLELVDHPERFEGLARRFSDCPSRATAGNLGQIRNGDTVPEFDRALASLSPGSISTQPIKTRYGFHIVRLDTRIEGRLLPFNLVRERIAAYLTERIARLATAQYLALLASRTGIEGVELPTPADLGVLPQSSG